MSIITALVALAIVGTGLFFLYRSNTPGWVKHLATAICVIFLAVWILQGLGLMGSVKESVPSIH